MKNINSYFARLKKKRKKENATDVDIQTIQHLFSRAIREEYGRQGEQNITPKFYKNGIIFVDIKNSIWAQELWMNRSMFVRALNNKIGGNIVKNIKIVK